MNFVILQFIKQHKYEHKSLATKNKTLSASFGFKHFE